MSKKLDQEAIEKNDQLAFQSALQRLQHDLKQREQEDIAYQNFIKEGLRAKKREEKKRKKDTDDHYAYLRQQMLEKQSQIDEHIKRDKKTGFSKKLQGYPHRPETPDSEKKFREQERIKAFQLELAEQIKQRKQREMDLKQWEAERDFERVQLDMMQLEEDKKREIQRKVNICNTLKESWKQHEKTVGIKKYLDRVQSKGLPATIVEENDSDSDQEVELPSSSVQIGVQTENPGFQDQISNIDSYSEISFRTSRSTNRLRLNEQKQEDNDELIKAKQKAEEIIQSRYQHMKDKAQKIKDRIEMERIAKQQERIKEVIRKSASNRETPRMQKKSLELFPQEKQKQTFDMKPLKKPFQSQKSVKIEDQIKEKLKDFEGSRVEKVAYNPLLSQASSRNQSFRSRRSLMSRSSTTSKLNGLRNL